MTDMDSLLGETGEPKNDIFETAYQLQEYISFLNKELNEAKKALANTYSEIRASGREQMGEYRVVHREQWIRSIDSAMFFEAHPQEFVQHAKITLGEAELIVSPEELENYVHRKRRDSYKVEKTTLS